MAGYTSLFLLVVGVGCVLSAHLPGLHRRQDAKESTTLGIYHGEPTNITNYPFMVSVHCNCCGGLICSGSIISDKWIVVSGDCADGIEPGKQYVMAGSNNASLGSRHEVDKVVLHPNFNNHSLNYNYGLIKVNQTFQYSENCNKINLPSVSPKQGTHLTITGWGNLDKTTYKTPLLQEGKMKVISKEHCEKAYKGYEITFTDTMGCVFNKGQTTPCEGDMSDPLTDDNKLSYIVIAVGVSKKCSRKALPAICADVLPAVPWIQEITGLQAL